MFSLLKTIILLFNFVVFQSSGSSVDVGSKSNFKGIVRAKSDYNYISFKIINTMKIWQNFEIEDF